MKRKYIIALVAVAIVGVVTGVLLSHPPAMFIDGNTPASNSTNGNDDPVDTGGNGGSSNFTPPNPTNNAITSGKIFVDHYVAGEPAVGELTIYNGNDHAAEFTVGYRIPDNTLEGYARAGSDYAEWVWISDKRPLIQSHESYTVTIRLGMPSTGTPPADKWEFWIGVIDQSQTGDVVVELAQRWLITMETS